VRRETPRHLSFRLFGRLASADDVRTARRARAGSHAMSDDRPWYREPETFIAVAALIVSVTAVVVGIYEAHLQRVHDRAEVWPRLEVSTFRESIGAKITLDNTGLGPAIIQSIIVTVDSAPQRDWLGTFKAVTGITPTHYSNSTAASRSLRAGDHIDLFSVGAQDLIPGFWDYV